MRWLLLVILASTHLAAHAAWAETVEQRFVAGLVARRMFTLAELACQRQLALQTLSGREAAGWTVELVRIVGQDAANSSPVRRAARWQAAHQVAQDFLTAHPDHPRRMLVDLQDALTYLAQGELARLEADVAVDPDDALQRARDTIRTASRRLESLDKQLAEAMAAASGNSGAPDSLTLDELFSLQNSVRFQLARAFRNQALCYPNDSNDRVAALSAAIKQLSATLTQLQAEDALTWQVYLDLAVCHRFLGDLEQAARVLANPLSETAPVQTRLAATAEMARIMIAADRAQRALDTLGQAQANLKTSTADFHFAQLEAVLALWKSALSHKDEAMAGQWQEKAAGIIAFIEQNYGSYWGRRAKLARLAVAQTGTASSSIEILISSADELYAKQQYDQAIATYEQAAERARAADDRETAAKVESTAALVEQTIGRHEDAAQRLRRLARQQTSHPQAPSRHLLGTLNAAQWALSDPSVTPRYQAMLEEHIATWPSSDTADQAREWLGNLCTSQGNWETAVNAYRSITPDAEFYPEAIVKVTKCYDQWLRLRQQSGQPIDTILNEALGFFDTLILGPERRWPERWSPAQLTAALASARLRLHYAHDRLIDAQRVLQAAMEHAPSDDPSWLQQAQSLLIVALAGQSGQQQDALQLLQQLGSGSVDSLLELIDQLSTLAKNTTVPVREQIAQIQLAALDQLQSGTEQFDRRQRLRIDQVQADALHTLGKRTDALKVYQRLAAEQPDNSSIQNRFAELLLDSENKQTLSEAITQWQKVARRTRPTDTDAWMRARYSIAWALFKRNRPAVGDQPADRAVAAQRLRYLKATSNVDSTPWAAKVDDLIQLCEQSANPGS